MSAVIWENPEIPGFPGREDILLKALEKANYKYIDMEFSNISGEEYLKRNLPELLVRGHQIAVNEIGRNSDQNFWISRWARAVFERNIRFVEFHFWKNRTIEDNLSYLRSVSRKIKSCGYELDAAVPPSFPKRGSLQIWICLALLVSVIFPLAGLKYALKLNNYFYAFLTVNFFSLIGASLIGCLLYDIYFLQKIADMPYVRIVFFLPIVFSIFLLFKTEDIKRIVNTGLQVKHLIIAVFVILVATVIIIRSGNSSAEWMNPDQGFRQMLENLLLIRPRTKEFLVGQPILLLGFFFKNPWLILIGMIGQVSIMNTFMHAHSSFMVSLIRTFNGLWVGLILGVIVLEIYKAVASKKQIKK
jgi:hypothetical protein